MFVLATFSAVPLVVVIVLTSAPVAAGLQGFSSQTSTVPPPVAVKAGFAPVDRIRPPEKRIVAPVLLVSEMPLPSPSLPSVMAPVKLLVPPVVLATDDQLPDIVGDRAVVGDGRRAAADVEVGAGGVGDGRRGRRGEGAGHVGERHAVARAVGAAEAAELQFAGEVRQARRPGRWSRRVCRLQRPP